MAQSPPTPNLPPYNFYTCAGSKAYFKSYASGATYYRWMVSSDNGANWDTVRDNATYSGANTEALVVVTTAAMNDYQYYMISGNAYGTANSFGAAAIKLSNNIPDIPNVHITSTSFCQGSSPDIAGNGGSMYADTILWIYYSSGVSYTPRAFDYPVINFDTTIIIHFDRTAISDTLAVIAKNACGSSSPKIIVFTLTPLSSTLPGTAGGAATCATYTVPAGGSIFADPTTCSPITTLIPTGSSPVTGIIKSCVTIAPSVQSYNGIPYVQRYYNIEPSTNPSTSTATLTLYYNQSDFDNYNLARGTNPALPAGPADASGISNLRITQFHGTGTTPGTYAGGNGTIDPDDNKIVWNAADSRWEVTFDITGFSGFFVSGGPLIPLPLTLISFTGHRNNEGNLLQWKTAAEKNTSTFEIQRNDNAANVGGSGSPAGFSTLAVIPAAGISHLPIDYQYTDADPAGTGDARSYRLKMTDLDGKFTYSKTVVIQPATNSPFNISFSPNPFHESLSIGMTTPGPTTALLSVTDISGKKVLQQSVNLRKGDNKVPLYKAATLQPGVYLLTLTSNGQQETRQFVKY